MRRRSLLSATALVLALAATGCGGGEEGAEATSPEERLAAAQATVEEAEAITITLTSSGMPDGVNGVQSAQGTGVIEGDLIKFEGEFQGRVSGITASVEILAIGDDTYVKLFTPDYEPFDLETLGAPNPTAFFAPETGIASLMAATTDLAVGEEVREGSDILTEITGTLPGERVEALLRVGGPGQTFDVTYGLTEDDELRTATLAGEFWEGSESSYTLLLTAYGTVVPIEAPGP